MLAGGYDAVFVLAIDKHDVTDRLEAYQPAETLPHVNYLSLSDDPMGISFCPGQDILEYAKKYLSEHYRISVS